MTVSLGASIEVDASAAYPLDITELSSALSLAIYERAGDYYARTVTIGTPPVVNAESAAIDPGSGGSIQAVLAPMTSTSCMIIYKYNGTTAMRARVLSVSGTAVTVNSHITLAGTANADMGACKISSTKIFFTWEDSASTDLNAVVLSVSGTTITENTTELIDSESSIVAPKCAIFSTTKAIVAWKDIAGQFESRGAIVNISGNTLTAQTPKAISGAGISASNPNSNFLALMSSTKAVHGVIDTGFTQDIYNVLTLNGNTFDVGADTTVAHGTNSGLHGSSLNSTSLIIASEQPVNTMRVAKYDITGVGNDELTIDTTASLVLSSITEIYSAPVNSNNIIIHYVGSSSEVIIANESAGVLSLANMTKPASIDASDTFVYVALLQGGTPILTKINTDLSSDGTTVFDPAAGDNIGVECGKFDADVIWIGGNFDGTNKLEKSEDGGSTFTVKDDGTFADIETFVVGPDSDDRVLVADETIEIQETVNSGDTWTQHNPSVGFNINAIARLAINVQETVFGNDLAGSNVIDYSINSGTDMEDFTTGDFPTSSDVTGVIVN